MSEFLGDVYTEAVGLRCSPVGRERSCEYLILIFEWARDDDGYIHERGVVDDGVVMTEIGVVE